jgi:acyl dehydratase
MSGSTGADKPTLGEQKYVKGRITDDDFEKMRRLIGYANPTLGGDRSRMPHYTELTHDSIRHYVNGYGDDNPLYCDRHYGEKTRWGAQIASPMSLGAHTEVRFKRMSDELRRETRGAFRGVHLFHSGTEYHFYRPAYLGDRLVQGEGVIDVQEKESSFSGGRSAVIYNGGTTVNQDREVVASYVNWFVHTEREGSAENASKRHIELGNYTDDDLRRIDEAYENEFVRGADTLWFEDVEVGDAMPTMVKGPLRVMDILGMHIGWGWGNYLNGPLKLDYKNRKRMPGFYGKNEFGAWDCMQRLHWDPLFAQAIGNPTTYDYGPMRAAWTCHYLTNFGGDDAWLYRMRTELRKFNFVGDTTWWSGRVRGKRVDPVIGPLIDVDVEGTNQRGEVNCSAAGTILLASREHGQVRLPTPPPDVVSRAPGDDYV